ncbi:MAG: methylated-DNA--[protein]-cysteine S-methyltransferase [Eggerthellaceae bacterium]|nr:methylated-DNA--[protein]-cysteine S-methyltransferase [Eggerthellaceae bacterium]
MSESTFFTYNTPVGRVTIASNGCAITDLAIGEVGLQGTRKPSPLTNDAANQLQEYLAGRRRYFDLPLDPAGSPFQKKVWQEMLDIPYGSTKTYGEIACAVGSPRGARAVGMAANRNPIAIVIPCHRVLASNGKPGGYAYGVEVKRFLLDLERRSN